MAKKISVALRKGGSGKTSLAVNLASALAQKGKNVLLVDIDAQCNSTISLGYDPMELEKSVVDLFANPNLHPKDVLVKTDFGLYLMPAHPDLAVYEMSIRATQTHIIKSFLDPVEEYFDYIFIDTPPSSTNLTVASLVASDSVIIPLQAQYLAMIGLKQVIDDINNIKMGLNRELFIEGILLTMTTHTNMSDLVVDNIRKTYGDLVYPFQMDFSVKHSESTLAQQPLIIYDPNHAGSLIYKKLANLVGRPHRRKQ